MDELCGISKVYRLLLTEVVGNFGSVKYNGKVNQYSKTTNITSPETNFGGLRRA
jgi:hypothetical protein